MYDKDTMQELYSRLKAQYPRYEVECLDDCLILTRLYGKVEVYGEGVKLYVNGTLYDQFSSEEVDDSDDLYEMIELFLLDLQHAGMQEGNETYCTARKKAARLGSNFLILMSIIFTTGMIALIVSKKSVVVAVPLGGACNISCAISFDSKKSLSNVLGLSDVWSTSAAGQEKSFS